jgi:CdiI immunity protein
MNSTSYRSLQYFFGCYFHQDFLDEFSSWQDAVQRFMNENSSDVIRATLFELNELRGSELDDDALSKVVFALSCYYAPRLGGITMASWLGHVSDTMRASLPP